MDRGIPPSCVGLFLIIVESKSGRIVSLGNKFTLHICMYVTLQKYKNRLFGNISTNSIYIAIKRIRRSRRDHFPT